MSLFTTSDDAPFVFGAYAAHLEQTPPGRPSVDPHEEPLAGRDDPTPERVDPIAC